MELFVFGGIDAQPESSATTTPLTPAYTATRIAVLWASWCDAVIAAVDAKGHSAVRYTGSSLTATQAEHVSAVPGLSSDDEKEKGKEKADVVFFGSAMHDGLRGYVAYTRDESRRRSQHMVLFATEEELSAGQEEIQTCSIVGGYDVVDVQMLSAGHVQISTRRRGDGHEQVLQFHSLAELRRALATDSVGMQGATVLSLSTSSSTPTHRSLTPAPSLHTNATTSAALLSDSRAHTSTLDTRYPKTLGRPPSSNGSYEKIPYLSETAIAKIASGGYLSAALSPDGELYLWGQACPGAEGELAVLEGSAGGWAADEEREREMESKMETEAGITGESGDEYVVCLRARMGGRLARVYDVGVGHGHVVVVAEVEGREGNAGKYAVFGAGENSRGQLGVGASRGFVSEFEEVVGLRGRRVVQLYAAGWSTFVVVEDGRRLLW